MQDRCLRGIRIPRYDRSISEERRRSISQGDRLAGECQQGLERILHGQTSIGAWSYNRRLLVEILPRFILLFSVLPHSGIPVPSRRRKLGVELHDVRYLGEW